ncbi:putative tail fiber protein [Escherichia phage vB_EcoP_PAS59]|uniref:Tail fiber protein n=1 Tax=Escherichia phage vB_EcoP_PAS59 TaxID=3053873 RepID=A0AA51Z2W3_9CAUD|nr:putative tail fiber protein [Escherichia phage vB_EcoP_PAS59]
MGAGGFRKNTGRNNTTLPYNVGFLNNVEDTDKYNVAVYDELQKVSTATNQMFQAIDEIHDEIDVRIKALNAMNLQFDELENRITTEIETAIADIQTQMGNLSTEDIWDNSTVPPTKLDGTVAGFKTSIEGANLKIQTVEGIVNDQGQEIALVQTELTAQGQQIATVDGKVTTVQNSLSQYMKLSSYEATWGVNSSVNGQYAGVKLTNNGTNSQFQVTANKFIVGNGTTGNTPFVFENGRARMEFADIKNVNITTAMIANARIQWAQIDNVSVSNAQIQNLAANKITAGAMSGTNWRLTVGGDFQLGPSSGGNRLWMNGSRIDFYDGNGVLRIRIGTW